MSSPKPGLPSTYFVAAAAGMIRRAVDSNGCGSRYVCPCEVGTTGVPSKSGSAQTGALRDAATCQQVQRGLAWAGFSR